MKNSASKGSSPYDIDGPSYIDPQTFVKQLLEILPVKNKKFRYSGVYQTQFSLKDSITLYNYMYKDATVYLERKQVIFKTYIQNYKPRKIIIEAE